MKTVEKVTVSGKQKISIPQGTVKTLTVELSENAELDVNVGENAKLTMLQITRNKCSAKNNVTLASNAVLEQGIVCLASSEVETQLNLAGQGASAQLGTMFLTSNEENVSLNTVVNHVAPSTTSKVNIYGALKDKSKAISTGNIKIEKTGQKTNAFLASHALLLDKNARAESIPALEIEANDVKAGHSASTTKLSQEELFYCRSRGLEEREAEKIIVFGFLQRAFAQLPFKTGQMVEEKWLQM